jgi:hypothetical protein
MPYVLGIDPGFSGGLALLDPTGEVVALSAMPSTGSKPREIDVAKLLEFVAHHRQRDSIALVVLERASPRPTDGRIQSFATGCNYGEVRGVIKALGLPLEVCAPQTWQKVVFLGTAKRSMSNGRPTGPKPSIAYAKRRWPSTSLFRTPACSNEHDGLSDSLCLAEYGRRLLVGVPSGK